MVSSLERRRYNRSHIDWPVSVYHPRLGMFINGRSVDVSQGGAKVSLPMGVAITPGQLVELNFPRTTTLAKLAGCFSRIKTARVVRIESEPAPPSIDPPPASESPAPGPAEPALLTAPAKTRRARRQIVAVQFDKRALSLPACA